MAKKLSDIIKEVEESSDRFSEYLENILDKEVFDILISLSKKTNLYVFSGVIRNFFLGIKDYRDIDFVLEDSIDVEKFLKGHRFRINSFGGYKIKINKTKVDLWFLKNTWGLKVQNIINHTLEEYMPHTAFFNFSSIAFSYNEKRFYYHKSFIQFLQNKRIDYVFAHNANPALCIVNTFYYADKLKLRVSGKLMRYVIKNHRAFVKVYGKVQIDHFGKILYKTSDIEKRIHKMAKILDENKKVKKQKNKDPDASINLSILLLLNN